MHLRHGTTQQSVVGDDGQLSLSEQLSIHCPQLDLIASARDNIPLQSNKHSHSLGDTCTRNNSLIAG